MFHHTLVPASGTVAVVEFSYHIFVAAGLYILLAIVPHQAVDDTLHHALWVTGLRDAGVLVKIIFFW